MKDKIEAFMLFVVLVAGIIVLFLDMSYWRP